MVKMIDPKTEEEVVPPLLCKLGVHYPHELAGRVSIMGLRSEKAGSPLTQCLRCGYTWMRAPNEVGGG